MRSDRFFLLGQRLIEKGAWYLAPLSFLYATAVLLRNKLYDWGLLKVIKVKPIVVSVGNIVAGGTGKTPFVHRLALAFPNRKVAILSRGYGNIPDEAMLLQKRLPEVAVFVGKDRAKIAQEIDADLVILDDGFQHRRLHRDVDIVLNREKKEHYLPWGFLRDSPKRLKKADEVFIVEKDTKLVVNRILDRNAQEISSIHGWKVGIFCGIARPENFKKSVKELGAEIVAEKIFADHEKADLRKLPNVSVLICTEKDFVKLDQTDLPIYFLEMRMEITAQDRFEKLIEKINQKIDNRMYL
jgi:tetraacyldisaccharide 4'-kinase